MPNQRISQGASAYFGMPIDAMMNGSTASVARCERRSRNGRMTPKSGSDREAGGGDTQCGEDVGEHLATECEIADTLGDVQRRREEELSERARAVLPAGEQRCGEQ